MRKRLLAVIGDPSVHGRDDGRGVRPDGRGPVVRKQGVAEHVRPFPPFHAAGGSYPIHVDAASCPRRRPRRRPRGEDSSATSARGCWGDCSGACSPAAAMRFPDRPSRTPTRSGPAPRSRRRPATGWASSTSSCWPGSPSSLFRFLKKRRMQQQQQQQDSTYFPPPLPPVEPGPSSAPFPSPAGGPAGADPLAGDRADPADGPVLRREDVPGAGDGPVLPAPGGVDAAGPGARPGHADRGDARACCRPTSTG